MAFLRRGPVLTSVTTQSVAPEQEPVETGAGQWILRTETCLAQTSVSAKILVVQLSKFLPQGMANLC